MSSHHLLSKELDPRLIKYAANSWSAYEAVFAIQQLTSLLPSYSQSLVEIQGARGASAARRAWGVAADLVAAATGATPSYDTLIDYGFTSVADLGSIKTYTGDLSLAHSAVLRTPFESTAHDDVLWLLDAAVAHNQVARPLLELFHDELTAWDEESKAASVNDGVARQTVRDLVRFLSDQPKDFPLWDGRPLLLDEQRAVLEYLARSAAAEIVADHLIDEPLGRYLLSAAGVLRRSDVAGEVIFEIDAVPFSMLTKPVNTVAAEVGTAVLATLSLLDTTVDPLDQLSAVEAVIEERFSLCLARAFEATRLALIGARLEYLSGNLLDLTDRNVHKLLPGAADNVEVFDFPEFSSDT